MPNCKEHEDCDLICAMCGSYYCQDKLHGQNWQHVPRLDMPDDIEAYRNEKAEEMP